MRSILGVVVILLAFMGVGAAAADFPEDLSKWIRIRATEKSHDYWAVANNDTKNDWFVFLRGDQPSVRLRAARRSAYPYRQESYPPMPFTIERGSAKDGLGGEWFSSKVTDGWIIGFNAGEWGGALWWFSPDGKKRSKISDDQIVGFLETEAGLLGLEGIAHGGVSRGKIIRITKGEDELWHSELFVDLEGAPETVAKGPDKQLLIATTDRLVRVDPGTKKLDVLVKDAFWGSLYPTTMICTSSGTIYLGMRHGVAEINKVGQAYEVKWLIPNATYDGATTTPAKKVK
jgi:hypothetical protein